MSCAGPPTGAGFLQATLSHLDCQAQTIGEAGYQVLANPALPIGFAVTALLSIFIAVYGIRLLMGDSLGSRDVIKGAMKVGIVLTLASSWPAYRTTVYDVFLKGPAEIAGLVGSASALPGAGGGLIARLQAVDNGILSLVEAGSGRLDFTAVTPSGEVAPPLRDSTALGWGKAIFVSSIIGSFGLLRIAGGLFLALAPIFAGFMLFEATRFLFFGWLRSLIALALGSVGVAIVLSVELAVMEPWLVQVLTLRAAGVATVSAPFELLALSLSFSATLFGILLMAFRLSFTSHAVARVEAIFYQAMSNGGAVATGSATGATVAGNIAPNPSRAELVRQAIVTDMRRDGGDVSERGDSGRAVRSIEIPDRSLASHSPNPAPLGRTYHAPSRRVSRQTLARKASI